MAPKTKKTETAPAPAAPAATETAPLTVEADEFATVLETLENVQKQVKNLVTIVKNLKKENEKLKRQSSRKTKKTPSAPRAPSGFAKPSLLSDELCGFLGLPNGTSMSRTDVTSKVNEYIKAHKLQDEKDKRNIVPDAKLSKILNLGKEDKLTYFNLQKFMKHHYKKSD